MAYAPLHGAVCRHGNADPQHQVGTFHFRSSQLDRFLHAHRTRRSGPLGRANHAPRLDRRDLLREVKPVMTSETLTEIQASVRQVHASSALLDYLQDLLDASRSRHRTGLSPRAGLALLHAAQAWALMQGREMVLPEDLQAVGVAVMAHRLGQDLDSMDEAGRNLAQSLLREIAIP